MLKQREQTGMAIRKGFEAELEYAFWASHDPRNPKRKLAWSGTHNEFRFVSRPSAIMGQRKIVSHEVFTKCGESTNYSKSYTVVQNRTLEEIPRFTVDDKATSLGTRGDWRFRTRSCPERC